MAASRPDVNRDEACDIGIDRRGVPTGHGPPSCVARNRPNKPPRMSCPPLRSTGAVLAFRAQWIDMSKKMLIDATHAEETRVVVVDGNKVEEFDFETVNKRQLAGNIYLAKVTRVEPSLQAAFVDYGGNRHGFLAFAEIHPDYYQIPVADRKALLEEERAYNRAQDEEENRRARAPRAAARPRPRPQPEAAEGDAVQVAEIGGMEMVDLGEETGAESLVLTSALAEAPHDHSHTHHVASVEPEEVEGGYRSIDHASDTADEIESIAEEDGAEEIAAPRNPPARRYKI